MDGRNTLAVDETIPYGYNSRLVKHVSLGGDVFSGRNNGRNQFDDCG